MILTLAGSFVNGYLFERDVPRDINLAAKLLMYAHQNVILTTHCSLAKCYLFGRGVPRDINMAAKILVKPATDMCMSEAKFLLGLCLMSGQAEVHDYAKVRICACIHQYVHVCIHMRDVVVRRYVYVHVYISM